MKTWLKFLFIPLAYFTTLFFFFTLLILSLALGCGFHREYIKLCSRIIYIIIFIHVISAVLLGYLTTKYAPSDVRYILANFYNFIFSIFIFIYVDVNKISLTMSVFSFLLFFILTIFGSYLFYYRNKKDLN